MRTGYLIGIGAACLNGTQAIRTTQTDQVAADIEASTPLDFSKMTFSMAPKPAPATAEPTPVVEVAGIPEAAPVTTTAAAGEPVATEEVKAEEPAAAATEAVSPIVPEEAMTTTVAPEADDEGTTDLSALFNNPADVATATPVVAATPIAAVEPVVAAEPLVVEVADELEEADAVAVQVLDAVTDVIAEDIMAEGATAEEAFAEAEAIITEQIEVVAEQLMEEGATAEVAAAEAEVVLANIILAEEAAEDAMTEEEELAAIAAAEEAAFIEIMEQMAIADAEAAETAAVEAEPVAETEDAEVAAEAEVAEVAAEPEVAEVAAEPEVAEVAEPVAKTAEEELAAIAAVEEAAFLEVMEEMKRRSEEGYVAPISEEELISAALYDLTAEELAALEEMEDVVVEEEQAIIADLAAAEAAGDMTGLEAAIKAIVSLEADREAIVADEDTIMADLDEMAAIESALVEESSPIEEVEIDCTETTNSYIAIISELKVEKNEAKDMVDKMAGSLAEIDPNTENGEEGKAFLRKMYRLRGEPVEESVSMLPETPESCIEAVAGKVIQIENLQEDVDEANSFRDFFANVYCQAYVNSLVTMKDGLSQIFPGGLDGSIESELDRLYGPLDDANIDLVEIAAIEAYLDAIETGLYVYDESTLIADVTPLESALALCETSISEEVTKAKNDREDYQNDYNFLRYLESL